MRTAALVQRLADTLTVAVKAVVRGADDLLAAILPKPEAQLVPVRVRQSGFKARR
ncbi:hypothetical protein [uncultured Methylobacterium sp.]|uniref:hypothetical protein n=1 Tax=uncultured Methylobacterium sp. TaxID=157278 RepID=UPI0035CC3C3A